MLKYAVGEKEAIKLTIHSVARCVIKSTENNTERKQMPPTTHSGGFR